MSRGGANRDLRRKRSSGKRRRPQRSSNVAVERWRGTAASSGTGAVGAPERGRGGASGSRRAREGRAEKGIMARARVGSCVERGLVRWWACARRGARRAAR